MSHKKLAIENPPAIALARVYVGTYGKYAAGSIAGEWVDLDDYYDPNDFYRECRELHADEEDPEYMFQDYECDDFFNGMIDECGIDDEIFDLLQRFNDLDDYDQKVVRAYKGAIDCSCEEALENALDNFATDDLESYAEEIVASYNLPEVAERYFDYEKFERDLSFDFCEHDGFYFYNH